MAKTEKIEIKNRWTGAVMFSCEVELSPFAEVKLGAAIKIAVAKRADLRSADLSGADLRSADLRSADLRSADLSGADLRSAVLSGADLRSADLRSAVLSGADLRNVCDLLDVGTPHGYRIAVVAHTDGIRIAAGCRWMTFKEAVAYWKAQGAKKPLSKHLLAYIKAAAKARKWKL